MENVQFQALNSDKTIEFVFNNFAFMTLLNEFGDISKLEKHYAKKPYDLTAIFLYCGVKPNQTDFTLDEARELVVCGGHKVFNEVNNQVTKYFLSQTDSEGKEAFLMEMERRGLKEVGKNMLSQLT